MKMNTNYLILFTLVSIFASLLGGCSEEVTSTTSTNSSISTATKLALGTLKLEGTTIAVTSDEASELLPLWQAYQSVSNSDTVSQVELDALVNQIQGVMTAEQVMAVDELKLTDQSLTELLQSLGDSSNLSAPASTPNASGLPQAAQMGGPGSMPGGAGDSMMNEINTGMVVQGTTEVSQPAVSVQASQVDGMLLNALIRLLETRKREAG
ncbi:MAG: hypothetical protein A2Y88_11310 [Chloroflexi bacterium RBG_13_48_10]|nr:MAG: hypothetical protein A2Y88_11310 [Chloroflexi bacterium RBG_13_48_10]